MMEPEKQIIRDLIDIVINLRDLAGIMSRISGAVFYCSVHTNGCSTSTQPLSPAIVILRSWVWTKVSVQNVSQGLDTKIAAVILVRRPRLHGDVGDNVEDLLIKTEGQRDPVLEYLLWIERSVPSQPPVRI